MTEAREILKKGLALLKLSPSEEQINMLLDYRALLAAWNQHRNLISRHTVPVIVVRHLLDSLSIVEYLTGDRILDLGSGAGLPGIPLAIMRPDKQFTLLESRSKKVAFLEHVCTTLALQQVKIAPVRAEHYPIEDGFDTITVRAFGSLETIQKVATRLCHRDGAILAMKGKYPREELSLLPHATVHPLEVPYLDAERHLVIMKQHA